NHQPQPELLTPSYPQPQYLHTLLTNILSFTNLQTSHIQIQPTPYLLQQLLQQFQQPLIPTHQPNHVIIQNHDHPSLINIH
ncbi:hypothetical protein, partial [Staphylococcus haemolyticus]|uniref:hypothetical protein n=1 Tax=Staphylococcus haemolyticus TaxID=1283 RepID=UPI0021B404B8